MTDTPAKAKIGPATVALVAGLICLAVYLRSLSCGFVNNDDFGYVVDNVAIRTFDGNLFAWAFGFPEMSNLWIPLTWLSFAVDYRFWGVSPFGYHLTNNLLHAANTGLVVLIADRLCRDRYPWAALPKYLYPAMLLFAGLFFGIHPLRVESVAWVSERKDVLNGVFTLGSMLSYLQYVRATAGRRHFYWAALLLFALSLMAKPSSIFVPFLFLLADWQPLQRFEKEGARSLLVEKLPFLVMATGQIVMTFYLGMQQKVLLSLDSLSLTERLIVSGNALFEYVRLELLPAGIIPYYAIPDEFTLLLKAKAVVAALTIGYCLVAFRKHPLLAVTAASFLLPLLPVLSIFQNGDQAMAARYTYLPAVFPGIAAAMFVASRMGKLQNGGLGQRGLLLAAICFVVVLGAGTIRLIGVWQDSGTLWSRVVEYQPLGRVYLQLGQYYHSIGRYDAAIENYSLAIDAAGRHNVPYLFNIFAFRGESFRVQGRHAEAVNDFTAAIKLSPHVTYYYYRGLALAAMGRTGEAERDFEYAGRRKWILKWFWNKDGREEE